MSEAATTQSKTVYHYIITVRLHDGTHAQLNNRVAITGPTTRAAMFAWVEQEIFKQLGTDNATVVFFDLAPDDMPGGA
jgi:hypothetical protein